MTTQTPAAETPELNDVPKETDAPATGAETPVVSPYELLSEFENAPSEATIAEWKAQSPNGRIQIFAADLKRVFVFRPINGMEMVTIQKNIPPNSDNPELEVQLMTVTSCVLWTNVTADGRLNREVLKSMTAGLPISLFHKISELSDFHEPERLAMQTVDL